MSSPLEWEFPGGKVEEGESPEEALVRELDEELGIEVRVGESFGVGRARSGERTIELEVFAARIIAGVPSPREHAALRWVTAAELGDLTFAAPDVPLLPRVAAALRSA